MQAIFVSIQNVHDLTPLAPLCLVGHSGIPFFILLLPAPWVLCLRVCACVRGLSCMYTLLVSLCACSALGCSCVRRSWLFCVCLYVCVCMSFVCMFVSRCCCCCCCAAAGNDRRRWCDVHDTFWRFVRSFVSFCFCFVFLFRSLPSPYYFYAC